MFFFPMGHYQLLQMMAFKMADTWFTRIVDEVFDIKKVMIFEGRHLREQLYAN